MKVTIKTHHGVEQEIDADSIITFPQGIPGFFDCTRFKVFHEAPTDTQETEAIPTPDLDTPDETLPAPPDSLLDTPEMLSGRQVYWLQSVDHPEVLFSLVDPAHFGVTYKVIFSAEDVETLKLDQARNEEVLMLVILSRVSSLVAKENPLWQVFGPNVRPNLNAPIVINSGARLGLQKVLHDVTFSINIQGT